MMNGKCDLHLLFGLKILISWWIAETKWTWNNIWTYHIRGTQRSWL